MTPRERAIAALELRTPDDIVPTFELEFQLSQELLGKEFEPVWGLDGESRERAVAANAELHVEIAERLDYSIIRVYDVEMLQALRRIGAHKTTLLCAESDGTMAIPDGNTMEDLALELSESPDDVHERLRRQTSAAIERAKPLVDAGAEVLTMCADYCFNQGPFLSPKQFAEFVTPYLAEHVRAFREMGAYVIKHTDGDIRPILDQLVDAGPHALHSLDPQGSVDIAEVKRRVGDRICLCGNVNCAVMQTGTDEEVDASARYALQHGMPGGGYIYCTSNVAFKGLPLARYLQILEVRERYGRYDA
jgi:uroporphyrinogen decarboxylase